MYRWRQANRTGQTSRTSLTCPTYPTYPKARMNQKSRTRRHLLKAQPSFPLSPLKGAAIFSPFHPFTLSPFPFHPFNFIVKQNCLKNCSTPYSIRTEQGCRERYTLGECMGTGNYSLSHPGSINFFLGFRLVVAELINKAERECCPILPYTQPEILVAIARMCNNLAVGQVTSRQHGVPFTICRCPPHGGV